MAAADHLEVPRQHGLFKHHGIDLGDGTAAHYLEGKEILRSSILDFSKGSSIRIIPYKEELSTQHTLKRAIGRIGEKNYNLLFNNCEHFAIWCKTGFHRSYQIEGFINQSKTSWINLSNKLSLSLYKAKNILIARGMINTDKLERIESKLKYLDNIHHSLNNKLEEVIGKLAQIINEENQRREKKYSSFLIKEFILNGQKISDQLNDIDIMKRKINNLVTDNQLKNK